MGAGHFTALPRAQQDKFTVTAEYPDRRAAEETNPLFDHIRIGIYFEAMDLVRIHECLCEKTRLRMVHLLLRGPLCVCHLQEALREPQVKMSRHLSYLRRRGMVLRERCGQWMVYRLPEKPTPLLEANLACLQDCCREERVFRDDALRLEKLKKRLGNACPERVRPGKRRQGRRMPA